MTKTELQHVRRVLERIKDPDGHVSKAIALVDKDLASFAARKGQLQDQYESDDYWKM